MKHKYAQEDLIALNPNEGSSDLELVSMVLLAAMMAKDNPSFYADLKYFLAAQTREGTTLHNVNNPSLSIKVQEEFDYMLSNMSEAILATVREYMAHDKTKGGFNHGN